jgi:hypothetical protein
MTVGIDQVIDVWILSLFTASSLCLRRKLSGSCLLTKPFLVDHAKKRVAPKYSGSYTGSTLHKPRYLNKEDINVTDWNVQQSPGG